MPDHIDVHIYLNPHQVKVFFLDDFQFVYFRKFPLQIRYHFSLCVRFGENVKVWFKRHGYL